MSTQFTTPHTGTNVSQENGASAMRETVTGAGGVVRGLRAWIAVSVTLVALLSVLGSGASAAQAETPWWHLASGARPAYLHAGKAKPGIPAVPGEPEVQEIVVPLKTIEGEPEQGAVVIKVNGVGVAGPINGRFVTQPFAEILGEEEFLPLNEAKVQTALEEPYGAGKVTVKEVATSTTIKLTVTSPGESKPIEVEELGGGFPPPTVKIVSPGTVGTPEVPAVPDGELYATADNLGNAIAYGGKSAIQFKDVLPRNVKAISVSGTKPGPEGDFFQRTAIPCTLEEHAGVQTATCTLTETLAPYDLLEMRIGVDVEPGAVTGEVSEASISGGEGAVCGQVEAKQGKFRDRGCSVASAEGSFDLVASGRAIAPAGPLSRAVTVSPAPVPFAINTYELGLEEEGGVPVTQAGAHPFQFTTTIDFNQLEDLNPIHPILSHKPEVSTPELTKDLNVKLPAGLIGNATAIPRCTTAEFTQGTPDHNENLCPADTAVGVATVTVHEPVNAGTATFSLPIFNLEPGVGEPARFAFVALLANTPVFIDTSVATGSDYAVTAKIDNVTQLGEVISSEVTFWGVPGDPRHDNQRGWACLLEARGLTGRPQPCVGAAQAHPAPFLSLPTRCNAPLQSSVLYDSWAAPGVFQKVEDTIAPGEALRSCNRLQFAPEIKVAPDGQEASKPTGLTVDVHVPQEVNNNAAGLASSDVKDISVTFPEGMTLNPAAADGLTACSEGQTGFSGFNEFEPGVQSPLFSETLPEPLEQGVNFCPDSSKVGTATLKSPLLPAGQFVTGSLYLATPAPYEEAGNNPFHTLVAMYLIAKDPVSGTLVKLPGRVALNQATGRITATFEDNPQLAFEDAEVHLFGGERAPLSTPATCGTKETEATFTPWSGGAPVRSTSTFQITSGPNGTPCPNPLPFAPSLQAGTTSNNAGGFSPLTTTISREDGQQNIKTVSLHMPPGLSGILKGVELCPEAQANAGTCGANSVIGKTIVSVGLGGDPFSVTGGRVFLTGAYHGAPFGLSIVNPAVAGPFNLGNVVVRAKVEVDPHTAQLNVTTNAAGEEFSIPTILKGIPLQIKHVNVLIDRPGFIFNPTNCGPLSITGSIGSAEGASAAVSTPLQVTNCAALKFAPKFTVSTAGRNSKAGGAKLIAKLSEPAGAQGTQANITRVKVDLPKQLPSRLTTLQKACPSKTFEEGFEKCLKQSPASKIGEATVTTPLLPVPLQGPAIFVSHGGEAFPSLTIVLQGYGVTIDLVGTTFISKAGITSTTFKTVPDVPFNAFTLTLPQGKFSALAANVPANAHYSLCGQKLAMPTEFLAQDGAKINERTKIGVTGCTKVKKAKAKTHKRKPKTSTNGKGSK